MTRCSCTLARYRSPMTRCNYTLARYRSPMTRCNYTLARRRCPVTRWDYTLTKCNYPMAMYNCPVAWGSRPTARDDYPLASDNGPRILRSLLSSCLEAGASEEGVPKLELGNQRNNGCDPAARSWHRFEMTHASWFGARRPEVFRSLPLGRTKAFGGR